MFTNVALSTILRGGITIFSRFHIIFFQKAHEEEAGNFDADAILSFDVLKQGLNLGNGDSGVGYSYENQLDVVPGNDLRNIMYDHNVYTNSYLIINETSSRYCVNR